jgi:hypothetical protein
MDKTSKYFVNLEKAFVTDKGKIIVQGIASGTLEDRDQERISVKVLQRYANAINKSGLPLTNAHRKDGAVDNELGTLTFAEVVSHEDGTHDLFIKGELDADNPISHLIVKKVEKGKQLAFSIEGDGMVRKVFSTRLNKMIDEFVDAVPKAITITTLPSYIPSFLEVLEKSYNLNKTNMDKDKKPEEPTVEDAEVKEKTEATETSSEEKVEDESTNTEADATADAEETTEDSETVAAADSEEAETTEESEVKKSYDKRKESRDVTMVDLAKSVKDANDRLEGLEGTVLKSLEKSMGEIHNVLKTFHDDIEALKEMPLQKKSKVELEKSSYDDKKKTLNEAVAETYQVN